METGWHIEIDDWHAGLPINNDDFPKNPYEMALFRVGFYQAFYRPWQDGDQITLSAEAGRLVVFRRSVNMEFLRVCFVCFFQELARGQYL